MEDEHHVRFRLFQRSLLHHHPGAALLGDRRPFLSRLEEELHRTREFVAYVRQHFRRSHQHGGVGVVPAHVTHWDGTTRVVTVDLGRPIREGIHVGTQAHYWAVVAAVEDPNHPMARDSGLHLVETEVVEVVGDQLCRLLLPVRKLRVLMDLMAPADHFLFDCGCLLLDLGTYVIQHNRYTLLAAQ
jgi:hypothetical protein